MSVSILETYDIPFCHFVDVALRPVSILKNRFVLFNFLQVAKLCYLLRFEPINNGEYAAAVEQGVTRFFKNSRSTFQPVLLMTLHMLIFVAAALATDAHTLLSCPSS